MSVWQRLFAFISDPAFWIVQVVLAIALRVVSARADRWLTSMGSAYANVRGSAKRRKTEAWQKAVAALVASGFARERERVHINVMGIIAVFLMVMASTVAAITASLVTLEALAGGLGAVPGWTKALFLAASVVFAVFLGILAWRAVDSAFVSALRLNEALRVLEDQQRASVTP